MRAAAGPPERPRAEHRAAWASLGRGRALLLLGAPGPVPGLAAGRRRGGCRAAALGAGGSAGQTGQQGLATVRGQHDAFVRLPRRGLLALSTLRHRDSYEWGTFGIVGSRYRVPRAHCHAARGVNSFPVTAVTKPGRGALLMFLSAHRADVSRVFTHFAPRPLTRRPADRAGRRTP